MIPGVSLRMQNFYKSQRFFYFLSSLLWMKKLQKLHKKSKMFWFLSNFFLVSSAPGWGTPESLIRISRSRSSADSFTWIVENYQDRNNLNHGAPPQTYISHIYTTQSYTLNLTRPKFTRSQIYTTPKFTRLIFTRSNLHNPKFTQNLHDPSFT